MMSMKSLREHIENRQDLFEMVFGNNRLLETLSAEDESQINRRSSHQKKQIKILGKIGKWAGSVNWRIPACVEF